MRIEAIRSVPGVSGFFFDNQRAIKAGAEGDGATYRGDPITPGFDRIREAGESLIVEVALTDGRIVTGDCCAVQYSGVGGRDPLFRASQYQDGDLVLSLERTAMVLKRESAQPSAAKPPGWLDGIGTQPEDVR